MDEIKINLIKWFNNQKKLKNVNINNNFNFLKNN